MHLKTVEKLWRPFRRTGSVQAKPPSGGVKAHLAGQAEAVRRLVAEHSDRTLAEYVALLGKRPRVVTSVPVLSRTLKAWGLPRKKSRSRPWNRTGPPSGKRVGAFRQE